MRWLLLVGLVGCYRPGADPACLTRCDPANAGDPDACPNGLVCASDGRCRPTEGSCSDIVDGGGSDSALIDMRPDDSTSYCYGQGLLRICLEQEPMMAINREGMIDTGAAACIVMPQLNGPDLCVIAAATFELTNVRAHGVRPLVVVAKESITLGGNIDVSSRRIEGNDAAGSNDFACVGTTNPISGAGGNGGSFGGKGGAGGRSGIAPQMPVDPMVLRGGCPGSSGNGAGAGSGGRGGGAIYLIAGSTILVGNARINASGAAGTPQVMNGGGGGGGSGGMIGLDAPLITVAGGQAFANGGGGAGGSNGSVAGAGLESTAYNVAGSGGVSSGASGGDGSLVSVEGESGEGVSANGGGGGGGAGVIVIYPASQAGAFGTAVSPPITQ